MKLKHLGVGVFLLSSLTLAQPGFSQPSETGGYAPGFWQPEATVDNTRNITVQLVNETGIALEYGVAGVNVYSLAPGGTTQLELQMVPGRRGDIASIPVNSPDDRELNFQYNVNEEENVVMVLIRVAGATDIFDRAIYIDEKGRVYSF